MSSPGTEATVICRSCGKPIRLTRYGWGHLVNPWRDHHPARPRPAS